MKSRRIATLAAALLLLANATVPVPAAAATGLTAVTLGSPGSSQRRGKTPAEESNAPPAGSVSRPSSVQGPSVQTSAPQTSGRQGSMQQSPGQATSSQQPARQQNSAQLPPPPRSPLPQEPVANTPPANSDDPGTIRIDTTLVSIPVSVLDRDGKYVPNLTKRDFQLFEDGIEQEISDFGPVEVPFHVVLMLDTSRSTAFRHEDIQQAAIAFVEQLRPDDRVMVVSFDDKIYVDSEFTSDRNRLRRAIYGTKIGGGTKLYDAVDLVISERLEKVDGRKAIVLFTDGVDTTSKFAKAATTLAQVEESGVLVYPIRYYTADTMGRNRGGGNRGPVTTIPWPLPPIMLPPPRRPGRRWPFAANVAPQQWPQPGPQQYPRGGAPEEYRRGEQYLRDLAARSGARMYDAETLYNLDSAFSSIANELRYQYALSYYPTNAARDGSFRRVRVRVSQANLVVRARDGYRAASDNSVVTETSSSGGRERPRLGRQ